MEAAGNLSQLVVLHSEQLEVDEHEDALGKDADAVVGEVHFGDGDTLPPVLPIERQLVELEEFWRDLVSLLPDKVEGPTLEGPFDHVGKGLLLYHF
jgi:hypothetical protein